VLIDDCLTHSYDFKGSLWKFILGMRVSALFLRLRFGVCWALMLVVPDALMGQTPVAVLHTQGGVWVNGYEARDSSSVFDGDLIETKPTFSASLNLEGSEILIQPESVAKFQKDLLALDHGSVSVGTSTEYKVKVNCITVIPVRLEWTQYDVTDINGKVEVAAHKNDVRVEIRPEKSKPSAQPEVNNDSVVHEGEQASYRVTEACGAPPPPKGPLSTFTSPWVIGGGAAGVGLLLCLTVFCKSNKPPVSPAAP
jgi:hypothetical protein